MFDTAGWRGYIEGVTNKDTQIAIRLDEKTRKQLQKEADAARRKLSDYVRYLIDTHPERARRT